eukprot:PhM_4_TR10786/c0_g2_i1/m.101511
MVLDKVRHLALVLGDVDHARQSALQRNVIREQRLGLNYLHADAVQRGLLANGQNALRVDARDGTELDDLDARQRQVDLCASQAASRCGAIEVPSRVSRAVATCVIARVVRHAVELVERVQHHHVLVAVHARRCGVAALHWRRLHAVLSDEVLHVIVPETHNCVDVVLVDERTEGLHRRRLMPERRVDTRRVDDKASPAILRHAREALVDALCDKFVALRKEGGAARGVQEAVHVHEGGVVAEALLGVYLLRRVNVDGADRLRHADHLPADVRVNEYNVAAAPTGVVQQGERQRRLPNPLPATDEHTRRARNVATAGVLFVVVLRLLALRMQQRVYVSNLTCACARR